MQITKMKIIITNVKFLLVRVVHFCYYIKMLLENLISKAWDNHMMFKR